MMRIVILAPIDNSLYARLVTLSLAREPGIELCGLAVRAHWNLKRVRSELRRDGLRLARKVVEKYLLGDARFKGAPGAETLAAAARQMGLRHGSLKEMARDYSIPYLRTADFNQPDCTRFLREAAPQAIVFTGGGLIRQDVLAAAPIGVLNCHSGILPPYRGMDVVEWTAAEGHILSVGFGATLHLMDSGVDSGPILLTGHIKPRAGDTFIAIRQRIEVLMLDLMLQGVRELRDGHISPVPQEPNAGRQYYVMHPRLRAQAEKKLARAVQATRNGEG